MTKKDSEDHFLIAFFRNNLPAILAGLSASLVTMAVLSFRVDTNGIRINALEDRKADLSLMLEKFDALNHRVDGLVTMSQANSTKLDRLIERFIK